MNPTNSEPKIATLYESLAEPPSNQSGAKKNPSAVLTQNNHEPSHVANQGDNTFLLQNKQESKSPSDLIHRSIENVGEWLQECKLGQYAHIFQDKKVDGSILLNDGLDENTLKELIPTLKHRLAFKKAHKKLLVSIKTVTNSVKEVQTFPNNFEQNEVAFTRTSTIFSAPGHLSGTNTAILLQFIDENIIGKGQTINGPWGRRPLHYADYTASGRLLRFIENAFMTFVYPMYANTHSKNNACSVQTTKLREEARTSIKKSVNATDDDVLIFTGSGATGAIHKLISVMCLADKEIREKTVVFVTVFEHHSNILPWMKTGVEIVRIPTTDHGILDRQVLTDRLEHYNDLKMRIICTFCAASNVTGIRTDVDAISTLVHMYSGLVFWDYATAAPYVKIDMNTSMLGYKDAIFMSTHKFIGGPGSPGILVAKKHLFVTNIPSGCGGGTVNFITRTRVEYVRDIETREEGGTPDILGSIRAGMVFQLKDAVGDAQIEAREDELVQQFYKHFPANDTLILLGSRTAHRLAIFSFLIYVPAVGKYLHHNFICTLLNDLFGIQVRSGCGCAGPYAMNLLDIDEKTAYLYTMFLTEDPSGRIDQDGIEVEKLGLMKPGFIRINLPYFSSNDEIEYILSALQFVATDGWKLLPLYTYEACTGVWRHRDMGDESYLFSLKDISCNLERIQELGDSRERAQEVVVCDPIAEARSIVESAVRHALQSVDYDTDPLLNIPDKYKSLIWFALPIDIARILMLGIELNTRDGFSTVSSDVRPTIPQLGQNELLPDEMVNGRVMNGEPRNGKDLDDELQ